jgi:hypothetical protein
MDYMEFTVSTTSGHPLHRNEKGRTEVRPDPDEGLF